METLITIDGASYSFETKDGKTELKVQSESTPSEDKKAPKIKVPTAWLITRKNGFPLFAVRPEQGEKPFRIITADKLYSEKIHAGFFSCKCSSGPPHQRRLITDR